MTANHNRTSQYMGNWWIRGVGVCCFCFITASILGAQTQQQAKQPTNFLYLRGGTASSYFALYTHTFGKRQILAAATIQEPRDDYREYLVGWGWSLNGEKAGLYPYVLVASATDSWYLEVWGFPWVENDKVIANAFLGVYIPLQRQGVRQFFVDPATMLYKIDNKVAIGASYTLFKIHHLRSEQGVGPSVQFRIPKGTATLDFFKAVRNYKDEVRLTLQFLF